MLKSIIVTGAGSGIGRATAQTFLKHGYRVGLIGRRIEKLENTANNCMDLIVINVMRDSYNELLLEESGA